MAKTFHRKLIGQFNAYESAVRDSKLLNSPSSTFAKIRAAKRNKSGLLNKLIVGDKVIVGNDGNLGFYTAIRSSKTKNQDELSASPSFH